MAWLHLIEPRIGGSELIHEGQGAVAVTQLRDIFQGNLIAAGGFEPDSAEAIVGADSRCRSFWASLHLEPRPPRRIREHLPLADYNRSTFYTFDARGYTDYAAFDKAAGA